MALEQLISAVLITVMSMNKWNIYFNSINTRHVGFCTLRKPQLFLPTSLSSLGVEQGFYPNIQYPRAT